MSKSSYKKLEIILSDESQVYIVEAGIDEHQVRSGDETGVVCHMVDANKADAILEFLNARADAAAP